MVATPKALVLGGRTGMVGQALVQVLQAKGWDVTSTGTGDIDYFSSDCSDNIEFFIDRAKPDVIFNTIAYTNVEQAEESEADALRLNRTFPLMLGKLIKDRDIKLVHYSTDFVFDGRKNHPYMTDDPTAPLCAYGRTKLAGEQALLELNLPKCCIIRTAWLFGPHKKNFVRTILNRCKEAGNASVVCDQIGSPTYTVDLATYSLALIDVVDSGVFHIVNSGQASWCELADEASRYLQIECAITPVPSSAYPQKAVRPAYSVLDTSRFTQLTGINIRPWPQALREYLMQEDEADDL